MERKRRLPSWMAGAPSAVKVSESGDVDTKDVITKEESSVVTEYIKPKSKVRTKKNKKEACPPSGETSFLAKCDTKRKKRGLVEKDEIECEDGLQGVIQKRKRGRGGRKVEESDPSRKNEGESNELESHDENDEDLTIDDMLSIAREFVENAGDMSQQKPSQGWCALKTKCSYTETSPIFAQDAKSPVCEKTYSHQNSIENSTSEVTVSDSRMTVDAAQDMLDLLLGPLLKKPIQKEEAKS